MKLKILQSGDAVLRDTARELTIEEIKSDTIQRLIDYMIETLRDAPGVGLAAPQVGEPYRIIVIEDKAAYHKKVTKELLSAQGRKPVSLKVVINPVLELTSKEHAEFFEGCLSVDGYFGVVPRAASVKLSGLDRHGKSVSYEADGWLARIFQHEYDHLEGKLYVDSMYTKTFMSDKAYAKHWAGKKVDELRRFIKSSRPDKRSA